MAERTLAIIKPDACQRRLSGKIIQRIEAEGFEIRAMRRLHLSKTQAEGFYAVHRTRPFFDSLTTFMSSGPAIVMVLEADDAIRRWRTLMGATDPQKADQGTLRREFAESIERNARLQAQLIDDLLDVSRIISGKVRLDVRRVELANVVADAVESMRPAADAKGVKLHCVLDPDAGIITGDPDRLQQIVWNLVSNAIKFTPRGGRVAVLLRRIGSSVEIVVEDTGQGIKSEFIPHLFLRFSQFDSSSTRLWALMRYATAMSP